MTPAVLNLDNPRLGQDIFEASLADALRARGFVTAEGLQEALRQQVLLGGHLATNLWELHLRRSERRERGLERGAAAV
jgi:hypothetical protein